MAEHMAVNLGSRLWGPYKELYHTISLVVSKRCPDPYQELEAVLRKHKPDLVSLLKNPAKNAQHREQVKKADVEGIVVLGQATSRLLPRQLIKESLIVSDLFDLNEYAAVELLLAGDQQQPHFPGLTRGRVAVVLYYDGRCSLVNALQLLIQARQGRTWTFDLEAEVVTLATSFTNDLISEGLVRKVLDFLKEMDMNKEINDLAKERTTLGDSTHKHDSQVQEFLRGLRVSLADCLYCLACQTPLNRKDTILLAKHLMGQVELTAEGTLDEASIALLMAFLYSIDIGNIEQRPEDRDVLERKLPIVTDNQYLPDIHRLMTSQDEDQWKVGGIKGVLQLAWALTLRSAAQIPELAGFQDLVEEDEILVDRAMQANAFSFLLRSVVSNKVFHQNEFYVRRIHGLLTDFIVQMPLKVKEIRNRGDEAGRLIMSYEREGLEVSADLPRHFEDFMHLLGVLYENDPLQLELSLDFWNPPERTGSPGIGGASYLSVYYHKQSQRQVSLFKFVRMAGDLLPPSLYIPYLHLLTGLSNGPQSAHQCFNLLKANGMGAGGSVGSVSWDHFFLSLNRYYSSLRQEVRLPSPFQELGQTGQAYRLGSKGITPHELEGLINVLKLVQAVARKDEEARLAMVENQSWLPAVLLFGLITCSIPPVLKGECLKTLAVFAQSPEIAATLWQSLEVSQVIPTVHQAGNPPAGILLELEEIESNNEEYPLTRGFLTLLDTLTDIPVPIMLGVGYRPPGFDPYLAFLRDSVFLKFQSRAYRDPAEKWEVAALVTKILAKLLAKHEPQPEDFLDQLVELQGGGTAVANKSPGHHLLVHMLNDSSMLQLILSILDQSTKLLSKHRTFPGKEAMEECVLACLTMLDLSLEKQDGFLDLLRNQGSGLMVTPLDQFLMGINPRTGQADHLCRVAKFVSFNVALPKHALAAVKVLYRMVRSSNVQPEIVNLFSINKESRHLLHGFVECLEVEDLEDVDQGGFQNEEIDDGSDENSRIHSQTRLYVMRLLLFSLSQTGPNLAHYLLGFNLRKPVSKTELQDPGVLGSPRTCLHSVLAVLERGLTARTGPSAIHNTPQLAELAYELIYRLCANRETSAPVMRYLRTTQDFFFKHLRHAPFVNRPGENTDERLLLNQEAWLLKAVAIELRLTTVNRQRSHSQRLLKLLLEDTPAVVNDDGDVSVEGDRLGETTFAEEASALGSTLLHSQNEAGITIVQMRRKILQLLDSVHFSQEVPSPLRLDTFEPAGVEETIVHCQQKNEYGVVLCNLRLLHSILMDQLNRHGSSGSVVGQRSRVEQEIREILRTVVTRNSVRQVMAAKRHAFDAWRQVLEVLLTSSPQESLPLEMRQKVTVELLQELLAKVNDEDSVAELTSQAAGAFLLLTMTLRQCTLSDQSQSVSSLMSSQYVRVLDGSMIQTWASDASSVQGGSGVKIPVVSLTAILKELIAFILSTSGVQQRVRTNLYGSLLNYLQIPQRPREIPTLQGAPALNSALLEEYERVTSANMAIIQEFGEAFCDLVCRDACDGHELGRTLALSVIDAVNTIDHRGHWLTFLAAKGYLRNFVEGLLHMDAALQQCLQPTPEPMKALYIYESTMSLLIRVAESVSGAQALLQMGLMGRLAQCRFLDLRPDQSSHPIMTDGMEAVSVDSFLPDVMSRYRQLLFPVLRLSMAILTSLGCQHKEATSQVLHFIVSHSDTFTLILREQHQRPHKESLEELALVTGVVCSVMGEVDYFDPTLLELSGPSNVPLQTHLTRLHRQVVALVPRFSSLDQCLKELGTSELRHHGRAGQSEDRGGVAGGDEGGRGQSGRSALLEIISHVIGYCRTVVVRSGNTADECQILFTPSLQEAVARDYQRLEASSMASRDLSRPPSLGLIVRHLRQASAEFLVAMETHQQSLHKLQNVADLPAEELKELSKLWAGPGTKLSSQQRLHLATRQLTHEVRNRVQELSLLFYAIECDMFLVWRHLEYYFLHCRPSRGGSTPFSASFALRQPPRNLADMSSPALNESDLYRQSLFPATSPEALGITQEDLKQLRVDATKCLSESLLKKAQEIESLFGAQRRSTRHSFVAALARRVRRLITLDAPR
ncbi:nuclear pore complex protein Nup205-like [Diadema setosum]|uniref:nuclear pore complex protein Nup205-like n=1 Tax=Diadema setosum TaxID=31175 RepID=UPI003B3B1A8C